MRCWLFLALMIAAPAAAQQTFDYRAMEAPDQTAGVRLPTVPSDTVDAEQWMVQNGIIGVRNVTVPTLTPVLPSGNTTGAAVIVAPGGAFLGLAIDHEGWQVARYLADHGIAAFVLKYRVLPTPADNDQFRIENDSVRNGGTASFRPPADTPQAALADGIAALRHVRQNAALYGIDPQRVGFMGFSAGGFLTRSVIEHGGADAPDFAAPIYPNMAAMQVPADPPQLFVIIAADDFLLANVTGLPLIDSYRAAGGSVEFHLLEGGGHGFGLGQPGSPSEGWPALMLRWMRSIGVMETAGPAQADNRAVVTDFARMFYTERDVRAAFETYVAEDYIQHNPGIADGRAAAVERLVPMFAESGREFGVRQIIVDGDMAVIHVHAIPTPGARGASVFDMYRLENGRIVEHWDAIQPVPETSANPHPMF